MHLEDLEDLREDVQELRDVYLKTHLFALFGDFADQVKDQGDQVVRDKLLSTLCTCSDIFQAVVDDLDETVRVLHVNLDLD